MSAYAAPLRDMKFVINELVGISDITAMPECAEITGDLVDAVPMKPPNLHPACSIHSIALATRKARDSSTVR